jgi:uncharacterized protein YndB with AHSA1/START domain
MENKTKITITTALNEPIEKVWDYFTNPIHIIKWNHASDDWHSTKAINDLRVGGKFEYRMEAKDGSFGFDFFGFYDKIIDFKLIEYTLGDDRKVSINFTNDGNEVFIEEIFEAESENPIELQKTGWQAILDNFKNYTSSN